MWLDGIRTPEARARLDELMRLAPEGVRPDGTE
jgi:hypothetical protein